MVTLVHAAGKLNTFNMQQYSGLSTDVKPINDDVTNGAVFLEMDTSKIFVFDGENKIWYELNRKD